MTCPRPRAVRWADVTEVTFTISVTPAANTTPVVLMDTFTVRPYLGSAMPEPDAALQTVGGRIVRALTAAYDAGETVGFGALRVNQHGIVLPGTPEQVPWTGIRKARLRSIILSTSALPQVTSAVSLAHSGRFRRSQIGLSGLPNGMFFPALLRHAAAQHRIPVHGR